MIEDRIEVYYQPTGDSRPIEILLLDTPGFGTLAFDNDTDLVGSMSSAYISFEMNADETHTYRTTTDIPEEATTISLGYIHNPIPRYEEAISDLKSYINTPEMHRNIFRGKNLGTVFTDNQKQAISSGTFDDLFVGDYWVINGVTWRIADIDYWWYIGDAACTTHHLVIIPDSCLYAHAMSAGGINSVEGGYVGSAMHEYGLDQAKTIVNNAFGEEFILNHRELLTNGVVDGDWVNSVDWYDSTVEIPNSNMMVGHYAVHKLQYTAGSDVDTTTSSIVQLSLMRLRPYFILCPRVVYWLRDIINHSGYNTITNEGILSGAQAKNAWRVRPVFGLTGGNQVMLNKIDDVPEKLRAEVQAIPDENKITEG